MAVLRPREGVCGGAKNFGLTLLQPARSVCVSLSAFFHWHLLITANSDPGRRLQFRCRRLSCFGQITNDLTIVQRRNSGESERLLSLKPTCLELLERRRLGGYVYSAPCINYLLSCLLTNLLTYFEVLDPRCDLRPSRDCLKAGHCLKT